MTPRFSPAEQAALFAQARQRAARHRQVLMRALHMGVRSWLRAQLPAHPRYPQPEAR